MSKQISPVFYWLPRILAILLTLFISIFALDVFGEYTGLTLLVALVMHLVPTFIVLAATLIAWKWEIAGGIIFILLGCAYIVMSWREFPSIAQLILAGPAFLTGALFLLQKSSLAQKK